MVAWNLLLISNLLAATNEPILLNFSGPACPHSKQMEPVIAELERSGVRIQSVNVEEQSDLARRFQVQATPTYVLLIQGRETHRIVGSASLEKLAAILPTHTLATTNAANVNIRAQSPTEVSQGNYLGNRLSGLFGKESQAKSESKSDPFLSQLPIPEVETAPPRVERGESVDAFTRRAVAAAVRLKVEDARGHSLGSGTIIDQRDGEALIVTCGHIFRESKGTGRIVVDIFHPAAQSLEGELIGYDDHRDIGLVSISCSTPLSVVPVAPERFAVAKAAPVFSVGCDQGDQPTARASQVKQVNRYQGPPNIEVAGAPTDGRSGGGLFSPQGYLVGVCNAADPEDDEGIFAALPTVQWQLEKVGLKSLYENSQRNTAEQLVAESTTPNHVRPLDQIDTLPEPPLQNFAANRESPRNALVQPVGYHSPVVEDVAEQTLEDAEIICIVRSRSNPAKKNQIYVLDNVSPDLLRQISQASHDPVTKADLSLRMERPAVTSRTAHLEQSQIRGQSFER